VITIAGEPGIGKTTLCDQLGAHASALGGRVFNGHCYERQMCPEPYAPVVDVLRQLAWNRPELGAGAHDLGRLLPDLVDQFDFQPATSDSPEVERWRLFSVVASVVQAASRLQPLVLIVEDLHDADDATIDLLVHLARNSETSRVLLIGTYRDTGIEGAQSLSRALAELHRLPSFSHLQLLGLTVSEVHRLYRLIRGSEVPLTSAVALYDRTEGNPLFVQEVARHLASWSAERYMGSSTSRHPLGLNASIPNSLRGVIESRLTSLGGTTRNVLSTAATVGIEFPLHLLRGIGGFDDEVLSHVLEEGIRARVLREAPRPGSINYRFAHALFRECLYEDLPAPRRWAFHRQIAEALEREYASTLDEHAAELAYHLAHSSEPPALARAIEFCAVAARRAFQIYAFSDAVRLLEDALQIHASIAPADHSGRLNLLLQLAEALIPAGEPRRVVDQVATQALPLAEELGDRGRASLTCQLALEAVTRAGGSSLERTPLARDWAVWACQYAAPDTIDRVNADLALANYLVLVGPESAANRLFDRALALSRRLGDPDTQFRSAWKLLLWTASPRRRERLLALTEEFGARERSGVKHGTLAEVYSASLLTYLREGDRARFEATERELVALAERIHDAGLLWRPLAFDIVVRTLDGHFTGALDAAKRLIEVADSLGMGGLGRTQAYHWEMRARMCSGLFENPEADAFLIATGAEILLGPLRIARGQGTVARAALHRFLESRDIGSDEDESRLWKLAICLETAVLLEEHDTASVLVRRLAPVAGCVADFTLATVARLLGDAALLAGDSAEARGQFERALEVASRLSFRSEIATAHLRLAQVKLAAPSAHVRAEALHHLDSAIPEFQALHMLPMLQRALALRATADPAGPPHRSKEHRAPVPTESGNRRAAGLLTAREREVASLLASGMSNSDIAEALVITQSTAEVHVKRILSKLGLKSRWQAAVWATDHGLGQRADGAT
jgi:DNA-binding CsgD family transcriptional regulator